MEPNGEIVKEDRHVEELNPKVSALRIDDIDVYIRVTSYEEKVNRSTDKFINRTKWLPMSHRFDVFKQTQEYFQQRKLDYRQQEEVFEQRLT